VKKKIHLSENFFMITGTLKLKIFLKSTHKQYPLKKKKTYPSKSFFRITGTLS
jgi:hypothetical protein